MGLDCGIELPHIMTWALSAQSKDGRGAMYMSPTETQALLN